MFKKIAVGLLALTILGAGAAAMVYNTTTVDSAFASADVLAQPQAQANGGAGYGQQGQQAQQADPQGVREIAAEGSLGDPWVEAGVIATLEDLGMQMTLSNGETAYIELGPADYWQNQGVSLAVGQSVIVNGTINEGMIHAAQVMTADGQTLQLRNESGQPLWSGGVGNAQGQNGNGDHTGEPQIVVDEWITLEGTLMSFQGGNMTMSTATGEIVSFRTGQPRFFSGQGITFQVGDEIVVVGFYKEGQFQAGDITQVSTGARVMLLDPNGRPLWAGQGNENGNH